MWVEKIIVAPSLCRRNISFFSNSVFTGSNPEKGSSNINNLGECMTVEMNCTFCAIPFDRASIRLPAHRVRSKRASHSSMAHLAACLLIPLSRAMYKMWSATFILRYSPRSSGK